METLSVSKFKATCLSVLEQVKRQKKRIVILKRGKPIAELIPFNYKKKTSLCWNILIQKEMYL